MSQGHLSNKPKKTNRNI